MGWWDSTLYGNDTTADIRDEYRKLLEDQKTDEEAYNGILDQFGEMIGTDEEPLLWFALADSMWKYGRLTEEIRDKALYWLERKGGMEAWIDSHDKGRGWQRTLDKLKERLNSPMPKRKTVRKPKPLNGDPWDLYDIYAYRFSEDIAKYIYVDLNDIYDPGHSARLSRSYFANKYILIQKVGADKHSIDKYPDYIGMRCQVFDRLFDSIPDISDVKGLRPLPFELPNPQYIKKNYKSDYSLKILATNGIGIIHSQNEFPVKGLKYVGNIKINNNEVEWDQHFLWGSLKLAEFVESYIMWHDRKYYEEEPGVYVYDPDDPWL